ncbi:glycine cleavage system protein R [Glaciecola petra]|uniref:Glycine cleavage system transcriptional repressor n=1 Tax=Glaciecola petra TaxID=3075602 RepID=A0ABU2ZNW7_9ALTE|nr:ACT domain-containing protein [Aestuariibacter sp. P117]MDT0594295.1 ACT domain-containing protein [Aestuariibacter sp. P117]
MQHELIINIMGLDNPQVLSKVTASISNNKCNILDSRHAKYGADFSLSMIVNGSQSNITALEINCSKICVELDLLCMMKRTTGHKQQNIENYIRLAFSGHDTSGLMEQLTMILHQQKVNVHALRQKTRTINKQSEVDCKMILLAPTGFDRACFDNTIKHFLNDLGLHGKISHTNKEDNEYIESW